MGWWGNNAKNRVSRTRSRCSLKRVAPFAIPSLQFLASFSANFPISTHPTSSILLLTTSSPSQLPYPPRICPQNCKISHLIPPRSRFFFPLSLQPLPRSLSRLNLCEVSPLPLLSGTAASSRSDFSHFPPQYAAMYVQKRGKSALPIASPPPASNPTQMDARSAYSSTRSQLVFRDCAMGSIWTTSIPWQSLKR